MARPLWSGTIQISLVGFAVEVYPATSTTRPISFREIERSTLSRIRRENVSAGPPPEPEAPAPEETEDTQEAAAVSPQPAASRTASLHLTSQPEQAAAEDNAGAAAPPTVPQQHTVARADIVKGYEYAKGKYAVIEPEELKNLRLAGKKTIELTQFAKAGEIDPALYEKPYFVMPKAGPQAVAFAVIRQSMAETGMVGIGEIVFSGHQHLMALAAPHDPDQPGMMLYTLRFISELRNARDYANGVESTPADAAQLALARQLIVAYTQPFDPAKFKDHYEEALRALIEAKIKNMPIPEPEVEKKPPKVVDLMEALRRSLARAGSPPPAAAQAHTETAGKKPAASTSKAKGASTAGSKRKKSA